MYFINTTAFIQKENLSLLEIMFSSDVAVSSILEKITIKEHALIASGCKFIDHDHGINKKELIISQGAVVAAGAIVNKSIPAYKIWSGIPAKKLGERK